MFLSFFLSFFLCLKFNYQFPFFMPVNYYYTFPILTKCHYALVHIVPFALQLAVSVLPKWSDHISSNPKVTRTIHVGNAQSIVINHIITSANISGDALLQSARATNVLCLFTVMSYALSIKSSALHCPIKVSWWHCFYTFRKMSKLE